MRISEATVQKVARLARLALTPAETTWYREQLEVILDYVDLLSDLPEVADSLGDFGEQNSTKVFSTAVIERLDLEVMSIPRDKSLDLSPSSEDGFYKVTKVMD